jgi:hypothetical protein
MLFLVLLTLRTWAVWRSPRPMGIGLGIFWVLSWGAICAVLAVSLNRVECWYYSCSTRLTAPQWPSLMRYWLFLQSRLILMLLLLGAFCTMEIPYFSSISLFSSCTIHVSLVVEHIALATDSGTPQSCSFSSRYLRIDLVSKGCSSSFDFDPLRSVTDKSGGTSQFVRSVYRDGGSLPNVHLRLSILLLPTMV